MGNIKQINITNRTYYFFNDIIMLKTRKNEQKIIQNIGIYRIGYITIKKLMIMKIFIM